MLVLCSALALWRGGFETPAQIALLAAAAVAVLVARPRPPASDPVALGLALTAAAGVVAFATAGGSPVAAAVPAGLVCVYAAARALPQRCEPPLLWAMLATALTAALVGLAGLALRLPPYAERIDGVWRAGGTLEYPPALAVLCACGLACALALLARGSLRGDSAAVAVAILAAAAVLTFDRAGIVLGSLVIAAFWWRWPAVRRVLRWTAGAACALGAAAAVALHPSPSRLSAHLGHDPLASRTRVYADAARASLARPLTGYGPGRFTAIYAGMTDPPPVTLAHDQVLEQAVEAGIAAAAGALLVLLAGLRRGWRSLRTNDPRRLAFALVALAILTSSTYDFTWSFAPLAAIAAIALARLAGQPPAGTAAAA